MRPPLPHRRGRFSRQGALQQADRGAASPHAPTPRLVGLQVRGSIRGETVDDVAYPDRAAELRRSRVGGRAPKRPRLPLRVDPENAAVAVQRWRPGRAKAADAGGAWPIPVPRAEDGANEDEPNLSNPFTLILTRARLLTCAQWLWGAWRTAWRQPALTARTCPLRSGRGAGRGHPRPPWTEGVRRDHGCGGGGPARCSPALQRSHLRRRRRRTMKRTRRGVWTSPAAGPASGGEQCTRCLHHRRRPPARRAGGTQRWGRRRLYGRRTRRCARPPSLSPAGSRGSHRARPLPSRTSCLKGLPQPGRGRLPPSSPTAARSALARPLTRKGWQCRPRRRDKQQHPRRSGRRGGRAARSKCGAGCSSSGTPRRAAPTSGWRGQSGCPAGGAAGAGPAEGAVERGNR